VTYPLDRVSFGAGTPRPLDAQIASQDASRRALSCSAMIKVSIHDPALLADELRM
jgi:hypothetical protein